MYMETTNTSNAATAAAAAATKSETQTFIENFLSEAIYIVIILVVIYISIKLLHLVIDKYFAKIYKSSQAKGRAMNQKRVKTLANAFNRIVTVSIWTIAVFVVLGHYGVNMTALITGAGAIGIFFGIAGKDVIMDLYVGLTALIEDQYRVGDEIIVNKEHFGVVEGITLRTIMLRDPEGNVHIVPHSMARSIINKTYDYSILNIELNIQNGADMDKIKSIVEHTGHELAHDPAWSKTFVDPIKYHSMQDFDKTTIAFMVQGKVKPGKQKAAISEFKIRINEAFEKEGIKQSEVNLTESGSVE